MFSSVKYIKHFFLWGIGCLSLASCVSERPSGSDGINEGDRAQMSIRIQTLNNRVAQAEIAEKISTFRVILIGEEGVEINRLISYEEGNTMPAEDFLYDFTWFTTPGDKTFYLIANEESIGELSFKQDASLPANLPDNLSEWLDSFVPLENSDGTEPDDGDDGPDPSDLSAVLNAVYFTPYYSVEGGSIYLPYSSVYNITVEPKEYKELDMFVVPVATKFTFNFINKRTHPVEVSGISIDLVNSANYLLATVSGDDLNKSIDGVEYYWVDWLAEISAMSQHQSEFSQNVPFNGRYGWITLYTVPNESDLHTKNFITEETKFTIPEAEVEQGDDDNGDGTDDGTDTGEIIITPSVYSLASQYVAESRNLFDSDVQAENNPQIYTLTLKFMDTVTGTSVVFEDQPIENLQALFRNTNVIINVTFDQGNIEVYAEIANWNDKFINGWVSEGQKPGGTVPFQ